MFELTNVNAPGAASIEAAKSLEGFELDKLLEEIEEVMDGVQAARNTKRMTGPNATDFLEFEAIRLINVPIRHYFIMSLFKKC